MKILCKTALLCLGFLLLCSLVACEPTDTPDVPDFEICTVIFETGDSTHGDITVQVAKGEKTTGWSVPAPEGYYHDGWFTEEGDRWDFAKDRVEEDMTLYARFSPATYMVWFEVNGELYASQEVAYKEKAVKPGFDPVPEEGMRFVCWCYEGFEWDFDTRLVTETVHLDALFEPIENAESGQ